MHILNIKGYQHVQCVRDTSKGGGTSIYILDTIQYKKGIICRCQRTCVNHFFIGIDKYMFGTNRNVIIADICKQTSLQIKQNELETLLPTETRNPIHVQ